MTAELKEAIAYVQGEAFERRDWKRAEKTIVAAGLCPNCMIENHRVTLNAWEPGNYWNHAGRACPDCETFYVCGVQPEYAPDPCTSDADPGL